MIDYVYAQKGALKSRFTEMIWNNMPKNKSGWVRVSEEMTAEKPIVSAKNKTADEAKFKLLSEQAKGFEIDGKMELALSKWKEMQVLKDTAPVKKQIKKLTLLVEAEELNSQYEQYLETIEEANAAVIDEDLVLALELYQAAYSIKPTEELKATIESIAKELLS